MQVFLSYENSDKEFASALSSELERRGLSVWLDNKNLLPGDNWSLEIGKALAKSQAMVVLISPESMRSNKVRQEIEYALGHSSYEHRLFPVEVRPTDEVPWILRKFNILRGTQSAAKISQTIADALGQVA
ncbi:MAG TPA: toll/interleukin-1 receptor domain-containing protein [Candidatus Eisenbacteria bacterium]|nr:toll/interleukin-1 receptor domain-containing protein [Candidatus Eisenbacteria bacterium]